MTLDARPYASQSSSSSNTQWNLEATPYQPQYNLDLVMRKLDVQEEVTPEEDGDLSFYTSDGEEEEKSAPQVEEEEEDMSFYTCSEQEHDETLTIIVEMTGAGKRERLQVREETVVTEALAEMMGITVESMTTDFKVELRGRVLNPRATVEEAGIEDQEFLVITPKLRGGGKRQGHTNKASKKKSRG